jgi:hypothetical protein
MLKRQSGILLTAELRTFAAVAMVFSLPCYAAFDASDKFWVLPELSSWHDSNVFRIADNADTQTATGSDSKGDFMWQPKVSGHIETDVSKQNFFLDGAIFNRNYQKHSNLNYTGSNNTVGWNWAIGSDLGGTIKYSVVRDLSSFEDVATAQRDMKRSNNLNNSVVYKLTSHWQFLADSSLDDENHSVNNELDLKNKSLGGGVQYITDKGSAIVIRHDYSQIDYANDYLLIAAADRAYNQTADQVIFIWPVSDKFKTTLNVGNVKWHYDSDNSDHSSHFEGINNEWSVTEKTKLTAAYNQQLSSPSQSLDTGMSQAYSAGLAWVESTKIRYDVTYKLTKQDYQGVKERTDNTTIYRLSSTWNPILNWSVNGYIQNQVRDSDFDEYRYTANSIGLSLQYKY